MTGLDQWSESSPRRQRWLLLFCSTSSCLQPLKRCFLCLVFSFLFENQSTSVDDEDDSDIFQEGVPRSRFFSPQHRFLFYFFKNSRALNPSRFLVTTFFFLSQTSPQAARVLQSRHGRRVSAAGASGAGPGGRGDADAREKHAARGTESAGPMCRQRHSDRVHQLHSVRTASLSPSLPSPPGFFCLLAGSDAFSCTAPPSTLH